MPGMMRSSAPGMALAVSMPPGLYDTFVDAICAAAAKAKTTA